MTLTVRGPGFRLRRAEPNDVEFLASLAVNDEIAPFLAFASPRDADAFLAEIERAEASPHECGRFVVEADDGERLWPAGSVAFDVSNRRSRIANLYGLMLHPDFRGRGLARAATEAFTRHLVADLNYHRVELECYGYNERAIAHFERCGFVREGVKRKAYWRHGEWVDGVLLGLVREDLSAP
ncbi:MAG: GNAT family N-acetyltransferase [Actinomycetota bacterium]|nr:GNAT family N-acetyltransferase [Actinomycetota bacterium]